MRLARPDSLPPRVVARVGPRRDRLTNRHCKESVMTTSLRNSRLGGPPDRHPLLVAADNSPGSRTRPDERLHEVFEERVDWMRCFAAPTHLAVDAGAMTLTYPELDERANQLAR